MKAIYYAQPFYEALVQGILYDTACASLQKSMKQRGHSKLYSAVLKATKQLFETKARKDVPKLTLAYSDDLAKYKEKIAEHGVDIAVCSVAVSKHIIGGYLLTHQNTRHDATYKSALYKTYQRITN